MVKAPRPSSAGVLAGLLALVALSCGSDLVDLLPPPDGGAGTGGDAGTSGGESISSGASAGGSSAGASSPNQGGRAGSTQSDAGNGGSGGNAGNAGNAGSPGGGCFGFGCGEGGGNGFGGSFGGPYCGNGFGSCTPCTSDTQCASDQHCSALLNNVCVQCAVKGSSQCKAGYSCDVLVGRCAPSCVSTFDCNDNRVCDPSVGTCVSCISDRECEQDGDPRTAVCFQRHCVECAQHSDCMQGDRRFCSGLQCVQCAQDKDCSTGHCDTPRGRCE